MPPLTYDEQLAISIQKRQEMEKENERITEALKKLPMKVVCSSTDILKTKLKTFRIMPHEKKNNLFFGCELELPTKSRSLTGRLRAIEALIPDLQEHAILKAEGCCEYGFEIVTVPATLEYHKQKLWGKFFTYASNFLKSQNDCGLHIHFSRDALNEKQLAKLLYFVHEPNNNEFLASIADRQLWRGNQRKKEYVPGKEKSIIVSETRNGRYCVSVSERNKGKSCEMRIFKSQHTEQGVMQALEFTSALIEYCDYCYDSETVLLQKHFLEWFNKKQKGMYYTFLENNLIRLGYIDKKASLSTLLSEKKKAQ